MVCSMEQALGKKARVRWEIEQPGDVPQTYAAIWKAERLLSYQPRTELADGIASLLNWLRAAEETQVASYDQSK
jgi:UDP-glucuronate 4-epimerase